MNYLAVPMYPKDVTITRSRGRLTDLQSIIIVLACLNDVGAVVQAARRSGSNKFGFKSHICEYGYVFFCSWGALPFFSTRGFMICDQLEFRYGSHEVSELFSRIDFTYRKLFVQISLNVMHMTQQRDSSIVHCEQPHHAYA